MLFKNVIYLSLIIIIIYNNKYIAKQVVPVISYKKLTQNPDLSMLSLHMALSQLNIYYIV